MAHGPMSTRRFIVTIADGSVCAIEAAEFTVGVDGVLIFSVAGGPPPSPLRPVFAVSRWRFVQAADAEVSFSNPAAGGTQPAEPKILKQARIDDLLR
jgi:hypothetical protein